MCGTTCSAERLLDCRERFAVVVIAAHIFEQRQKMTESPLIINPA